jgi:hypothetical protein
MRRFDLKTVLGAFCMLNIIERAGQDGKSYTNVAGVSPVPAMIKQNGMPAAINKNEIFNLTDPDMEMFNGFSEHLKKKIMSSPEWEKLQGKIKHQDRPDVGAAPIAFDDDDSIPF